MVFGQANLSFSLPFRQVLELRLALNRWRFLRQILELVSLVLRSVLKKDMITDFVGKVECTSIAEKCVI
jgi:hypothetical protein